MRDERQYFPKNADASEGRDRAAEDSCYLAQQADADGPSAARGPTLRQFEVGAARNPITSGWDQRPGADLPHFDQTAGGWISNMRVVTPGSATLAVCMVTVAIVTAFGLGWFCGSRWCCSRTAGAKTLARTVSVPLRGASGKRAALITGSIAGPVSRNLSTPPGAPSAALAEQHVTTLQAPSAPPGDMESGPRLMPFPETRPATIDGWSVRDVYGATAVLVGTDGVWTVKPGDYVPGVGRIVSITRWGSRWIVVTTTGLISTQ